MKVKFSKNRAGKTIDSHPISHCKAAAKIIIKISTEGGVILVGFPFSILGYMFSRLLFPLKRITLQLTAIFKDMHKPQLIHIYTD